MASLHFGNVLDKRGSDKKVWLLIVPAVLALGAAIVWGFSTVSSADSARADGRRAQARVTELESSLEQRDKLLTQAREDEGVMKSAGQAAALFAGVAPGATESGVLFANPSQKTARVYLYGLVTPPAGQQYVVAARGKDGAEKGLGKIIPDEQGNGFLLARDLPEGTIAIELVHAPAAAAAGSVQAKAGSDGASAPQDGAKHEETEGRMPVDAGKDVQAKQEGGDEKARAQPVPEPISLEGATPRVAARYPSTPEERGILAEQTVQARRARR